MMAWLPFDDEHDEHDEHNGRDGHDGRSERARPKRDLAELLAQRLLADPRVWGQHITVHVQQAVVMLEGSVSSVAARDAVVEAARNLDGVRDVCSLLCVSEPAIEGGAASAAPAAPPDTADEFDRIVATLLPAEERSDRDTGTQRRIRTTAALPAAAGIVLWMVVTALLAHTPAPGPLAAAATVAVLTGSAVAMVRQSRHNRK
ncbi:BON domain-containing protein [Dactylosporangium aurantiacum]|uniref:BON domain-containing protein n=1 Tax=Dactylosporangium aurantiacum TaxID=35754 RepID=A0A9Q9IBR5_9ACTN|nr:BON domain-containing protein [Dactylosporangium aurantiacum]MDG6108703.1 BON domain-containing protein [Dactylosporangium aurantiacum]UWZ51067.1 BON domain-containing protein [Dactylosporangium aurantiacum]